MLNLDGEKVTVNPGLDGVKAPVKVMLPSNGPTGDTDTVKSSLDA